MTQLSNAGIKLWEEAKKIIPGGTQLLSKRSEMFLPKQWPSYFSKARGTTLWDLSGKPYTDMAYMGIGACILGYADQDVNQAVKQVIDNGSMSTLNSPEEVTLARLLLKLHPWAQSVRYARTGGEAMAIAVRIARASTGRDVVAFCGYHGWHDWYLAANLSHKNNLDGQLLPGLAPLGVPRGLQGTAFPFHYNSIDELKAIAQKHKLAAIVMEPRREHEPEPRFLQEVRSLARQCKAALIFDEITSGWRMNLGGIHLLYKISPDIAVFAKAMSNGYPMAAIIGKRKVMDYAQKSFISSTYWTERIGPVAAIATIKKMRKRRVQRHLIAIGTLIGKNLTQLSKKHAIGIELSNIPPLITFKFAHSSGSQALHTLYNQEMLKKGYLVTKSVYVSFAHTKDIVEKYIQATNEVFFTLKKAIEHKKIHDFLEGPIAHKGFKRLT